MCDDNTTNTPSIDLSGSLGRIYHIGQKSGNLEPAEETAQHQQAIVTNVIDSDTLVDGCFLRP
jgi:hypothetical protein